MAKSPKSYFFTFKILDKEDYFSFIAADLTDAYIHLKDNCIYSNTEFYSDNYILISFYPFYSNEELGSFINESNKNEN